VGSEAVSAAGPVLKVAGPALKAAGLVLELAGTVLKLVGTVLKLVGPVLKLAGPALKLAGALVTGTLLPGTFEVGLAVAGTSDFELAFGTSEVVESAGTSGFV